jgi:hypothetical protein
VYSKINFIGAGRFGVEKLTFGLGDSNTGCPVLRIKTSDIAYIYRQLDDLIDE